MFKNLLVVGGDGGGGGDQITAESVKLLCFIVSQSKCPQVIIFLESSRKKRTHIL